MPTRPIRQFLKGQTIIQEGSIGDCSFKIIQGQVVICKKNENGNLIPVAKLGTGEIFGEMYLFESSQTRTATAIAVSDEVTVEIYARAELVQMLQPLSPSTQEIFKGLSHRLQRISSHYVGMTQPNQDKESATSNAETFITRKQK